MTLFVKLLFNVTKTMRVSLVLGLGIIIDGNPPSAGLNLKINIRQEIYSFMHGYRGTRFKLVT